METIILQRTRLTDDATFGIMVVGGTMVATLEDKIRKEKVYGETAIPAGRYTLLLRNEGGKTLKYADRYPDMHEGMIWLQDVKGFTYVYIHVGNYPKDTLGCILVGERAKQHMIQSSSSAYKKIYPKIVKMIKDKGCQLIIRDEDYEDEDND